MKIVLSLSGGLDSATILGYYLRNPHLEKVICCSFTYGSKHNVYELAAAKNVVKHYQERGFVIEHLIFDLSKVFEPFSSNLLKSGGDIPEGHYEAESMKLTVVPGRNLIFASILAGVAESKGANYIALGVHAGDHIIYPDCRPAFVNSLNQTIVFSTDNKVLVDTPYIHNTKKEIVGDALKFGVPIHLTRTCYKDQPIACGKCGSCRERLEAFELNKTFDKIEYEK